ncbi:ParB/RepB/Spo0J family partition protein [Citricoccus muralis]|uniref:ParB/RepB/Spo0J family partition protein n=1 Tax=Citricoccus muralis TaxID=169134 RepID=UPI003D6B4941
MPNPRQPRDVFNEEDMDELIASIREVGVLQPIVVRPTNSDHYELVMGERRWRASRAAGLMEIPVIIRHTADEDLLRDALLENIHRSELNPLEEAAAYEQLLRDFNCTQDELSERIGRSRPQISNTLRLMKLPPLVQRRVASGVLSAGHARALLGLQDEATMERVAQRVMNEGLSVRATEELVALTVNGTGIRRRATRVTPAQNERFEYLANTLTDELDTTVKISLGAKKGRIAIDFASVEDLNRIMDIIQPSKRASDS